MGKLFGIYIFLFFYPIMGWSSLFHIPPTVQSRGISSDSGVVVAYWKFDEDYGNIVHDVSSYQNDGTTIGTSIIPGVSGNARRFNGTSEYIYIPNPLNGSLDFDSSQSFTIDLWFKTTANGVQDMVRRGLAPVPGYQLRVIDGYVIGQVGNRLDGSPPDNILMISSERLYNDGVWHHAVFVRDRALKKLFLYVDGYQATQPIQDDFPIPLISSNPLEIGRWGALGGVEYFNGTLDEICLSRGALHPWKFSSLICDKNSLEFGLVKLFTSLSQNIELSNVTFYDTLHIDSMTISNPDFGINQNQLSLLPGSHHTLEVTYTPSEIGADTGTLNIYVHAIDDLPLNVKLSGEGFSLGQSPVINSILDIPDDQGKQVRIRWYPSIYDANSESLKISEYSVWRRVDNILPEFMNKPNGELFTFNNNKYVMLNSELWDFIVKVPAVRFSEYSYVAPTLFNATRDFIRWSAFKIAAHTTTGEFFFSEADSGYSGDNIFPPPPTGISAHWSQAGVSLGWDEVISVDLESYHVYRSSSSIIAPIPSSLVGITHEPKFQDPNIGNDLKYYYLITSVDSSGNESLRTPGLHSTVHSNIFYDSCNNSLVVSWNKYIGCDRDSSLSPVTLGGTVGVDTGA